MAPQVADHVLLRLMYVHCFSFGVVLPVSIVHVDWEQGWNCPTQQDISFPILSPFLSSPLTKYNLFNTFFSPIIRLVFCYLHFCNFSIHFKANVIILFKTPINFCTLFYRRKDHSDVNPLLFRMHPLFHFPIEPVLPCGDVQ